MRPKRSSNRCAVAFFIAPETPGRYATLSLYRIDPGDQSVRVQRNLCSWTLASGDDPLNLKSKWLLDFQPTG